MPDRIIRDELLQSERWLGLSSDTARVAYLALLLTADALGDRPASPERLYRLWRDFDTVDGPDDAEKIATELVAANLIRFYFVAPDGTIAEKLSTGARYLNLPRYNQSLRFVKRTFPVNPWATDEQKQAIARNSHGALAVHTTSPPRAHSARTTSAPDDVGVGVGVGVGVDVSNGLQKTRVTTAASKRVPKKRTPVEKISDPQPAVDPAKVAELAASLAAKLAPPAPVASNGPQRTGATVTAGPAVTTPSVPGWSLSERGIQQRAMELGLPAHTGEGWKAWAARLIAADAALPPAQRRG